MTPIHRPGRIFRSLAAIFTGVVTTVVLSIGTDAILTVIGFFPGSGGAMSDSLLLLATGYRTLYAVAGGYVAARLAPDRPMRHALILGTLGLIVSLLGAATMWNHESTIAHRWYPIALVILALPPAWMGGRLREMQRQQRPGG